MVKLTTDVYLMLKFYTCLFITGIQVTTVKCVDVTSNDVIDDTHCKRLYKPKSRAKACNRKACPPR